MKLLGVLSLLLATTPVWVCPVSAGWLEDWDRMETIEPKGYICYRTIDPIRIDGRLDENSWRDVPWTDDFADIQQNTLRYYIAILASAAQIIEDRPVYAGRPKVEHSLQLDIVYPSEPSRLLAFLRITGVGILLAALPHILLLAVLTLGMLILIPVGLIAIIESKRWPALLFDFMYRYLRYVSRVKAYILGLVDKYPSFIF